MTHWRAWLLLCAAAACFVIGIATSGCTRTPPGHPMSAPTPWCLVFDYEAEGQRWPARACWSTARVCEEARDKLQQYGRIKGVRVGGCEVGR